MMLFFVIPPLLSVFLSTIDSKKKGYQNFITFEPLAQTRV